ncbi:hypothetical protein EDD53_1296 [Pacificibacter maritimus]|uniref:Uncharacterized protein n=1 Tax=Pacificibacter maritimus TaxID=762213 RepID=A0A3N4UP04_9RHOB|nr:hypothetical protein EDD53_1296 [Pacificibacter maritimus]
MPLGAVGPTEPRFEFNLASRALKIEPLRFAETREQGILRLGIHGAQL